MKVLVVAAHPDDEVLGCGGTMARLSAEGVEVHVRVLAEGSRARNDGSAADVKALRSATRRALERLGVTGSVVHHDFPDNQMDTVPLLAVTKIVEEAIAQVEPSAVYTHHIADLNVDHQVTSRAVLTATRPTPDHPVVDVYSWENLSSTEWVFDTLVPAFHPTVFVDIGPVIDRKLEAMKEYAAELRSFPHARSLPSIEALARHRGATVGVSAAEAFVLVRSIRRSGV